MFAAGQIVKGVKAGRFKVVKCVASTITGGYVVTVREIGPQDQLASSTMRLPGHILTAE